MIRKYTGTILFSFLMLVIPSCSPGAVSGSSTKETIPSPTLPGKTVSGTALPSLSMLPIHPDADLPFFHPAVPEGAIARVGTGQIWSTGISRDWGKMAFGLNDSLIVCDPEECRSFYEGEIFTQIGFSHDGKRMATLGENISLWNVESGEEIKSTPFQSRYDELAFSADGFTVAASGESEIVLWDGESGEKVGTLAASNPDTYVISLAFSGEGEMLAAGMTNGDVVVWDAGGQAQSYLLQVPDRSITSVAFSPDGKSFAAGSYHMPLRVCDLSTGEVLGEPLAEYPIYALDFSPDGKVLAAASSDPEDDAILFLVYMEDLSLIRNPTGHLLSINGIAFSPDGKTFLTTSCDGTIIIWDATKQ